MKKRSARLIELAEKAADTGASWNECKSEAVSGDVVSAVYSLTAAVYFVAIELAKTNEFLEQMGKQANG